MPSIEVTSEEYRKASKEFFLSLKDPETTEEQAENGFKCLALMYMGLDLKEFDHLPNQGQRDYQHNYNAGVLKLASKYYTEWQACASIS